MFLYWMLTPHYIRSKLLLPLGCTSLWEQGLSDECDRFQYVKGQLPWGRKAQALENLWLQENSTSRWHPGKQLDRRLSGHMISQAQDLSGWATELGTLLATTPAEPGLDVDLLSVRLWLMLELKSVNSGPNRGQTRSRLGLVEALQRGRGRRFGWDGPVAPWKALFQQRRSSPFLASSLRVVAVIDVEIVHTVFN